MFRAVSTAPVSVWNLRDWFVGDRLGLNLEAVDLGLRHSRSSSRRNSSALAAPMALENRIRVLGDAVELSDRTRTQLHLFRKTLVRGGGLACSGAMDH